MMIKKLLDVRNKLKSKKPTFRRHDSHKKSRLSSSWRRPRGRQSKQRLQLKGYARRRATGYGSPSAVKGLSRNGLVQVLVTTKKDLLNLNPKTDGVILSKTLGNKKRSELIKEIIKLNLTVLNLDVEKFNKNLEAELKEKVSRKNSLTKKREAKAKISAKKKDSKAKKSADDKAKSKPVLSDEEKKVAEKKEHDKILTKKGDQQ